MKTLLQTVCLSLKKKLFAKDTYLVGKQKWPFFTCPVCLPTEMGTNNHDWLKCETDL